MNEILVRSALCNMTLFRIFLGCNQSPPQVKLYRLLDNASHASLVPYWDASDDRVWQPSGTHTEPTVRGLQVSFKHYYYFLKSFKAALIHF